MDLSPDHQDPRAQADAKGPSASPQAGTRPSSSSPPVGKGGAYYPRPDLAGSAHASGGRRGGLLLLACIGCAAVVGLGVLLSRQSGNARTPRNSAAMAARPPQEAKVLIVSDRDRDRQATATVRAELQQGKIPAILAEAAPEIREQVKTGEMELFTLRVFDILEEDGDTLDVFLDQAPYRTVVLSHAGSTLMIALKPKANNHLRVVARVDGGGGGITFGAKSSQGDLRTRVMAPGDHEDWILTAP